MTFVLDASVAIAGEKPDESSQRAEAVLSRLTATHAVVPSLWIYEVASALRSAESRGRITEADSVLALRSLSALPLTTGFGGAQPLLLLTPRQDLGRGALA